MKFHLPILLALATMVTGCLKDKASSKLDDDGPGTSTGGSVTLGSLISGIAATGAPVVNGSVDIKGSNGVVVSTITTSTGSYSVDVDTLTEPYLIKVTTPSGEKLISVASERDREVGRKVNVTPLTYTIAANVFEQKDADALFDNFEAQASEFTETKLDDAVTVLKDNLIAAGVLQIDGLSSGDLNLMNGTLNAGSNTGMDKLLDALKVSSTGANIEISFKGSSDPIITDDVTTSTDVVDPADAADITAIETQLTDLDSIKAFYTAAATTFAGMIPCNGEAVKDDPTHACYVDTLADSFSAYMHPDDKWDGIAFTAASRGFMCKESEDGEEGGDVTSRSACNFIEAGLVTFKDVTITEYKELAGTDAEATVTMNMYMDGVYRGNDSEILKKENGVWKFYGNQRKYRLNFDSQTVHRSHYNLDNVLQPAGEKFSAELAMYVDQDSAFLESTGISLEAVNEDGTPNTALNSALGSLALSVREGQLIVTAQAARNFQTGETYAVCPMDPSIQCGVNYDANVISLSAQALAVMESKQKFKLSYNDGAASVETFYLNKPFSVSAATANKVMPSFASTSLCSAPAASYQVLAPFGTSLNHLSVYFGMLNGSDYSGSDAQGQVEGSSMTLPTPAIGALTGDVNHAYFYLKGEDEQERRYVRIIECRNF